MSPYEQLSLKVSYLQELENKINILFFNERTTLDCLYWATKSTSKAIDELNQLRKTNNDNN